MVASFIMTSRNFRFGLVVTLVAARSISPGEEVTVNYNYSLSVAPDWYKQCLRQFNMTRNVRE